MHMAWRSSPVEIDREKLCRDLPGSVTDQWASVVVGRQRPAIIADPRTVVLPGAGIAPLGGPLCFAKSALIRTRLSTRPRAYGPLYHRKDYRETRAPEIPCPADRDVP